MQTLAIFRGMLSEIDKLLKIYFTFPATSVTSERSFVYKDLFMSDCRLNLFLLNLKLDFKNYSKNLLIHVKLIVLFWKALYS